jgi:AcrR family transcriptional regulator
LAAAIEIFAEKGYRDATIAEISERAGTNIASVNYHFGDKETLYREAWRQSFRDSLEKHPPDGGIGSEAPAKQRLRARIVSLLRRITDNNNKEFLIVHKELANPTGLLEEVMHEELRPLRRKIQDIVREVLGPLPSETQVRFSAIGIIGQCIMPGFLNRTEKGVGELDYWRIEDVEIYAEHLMTFNLAGLRALRDGAEKD